MISFCGQKFNMKMMKLAQATIKICRAYSLFRFELLRCSVPLGCKAQTSSISSATLSATHSAGLEESSRGGLSRWAACSKELLASFSPKSCRRHWWELDSSRYFRLVWNRWRRGNCRRSRQWCRNGLSFVKSINKYVVKYACENKILQIHNLRAEFKID